MGLKDTRLAESEWGVWFSWKRHGICTPHFTRKNELVPFRRRKPDSACPQLLEPRSKPQKRSSENLEKCATSAAVRLAPTMWPGNA